MKIARSGDALQTDSALGLTLTATTTETSGAFTGTANSVSVRAEGRDVWIAFDATAVAADPSIFLRDGEEFSVGDCGFSTVHAITESGTATVRVVYA